MRFLVFLVVSACLAADDPSDMCFERDNAEGCIALAGTEENPFARWRLYERACNLGSLEGCAGSLASGRAAGAALPDPGPEVARMTAACDADLPAGCRELGFLLSGQAARDAFGKACKLGDSEACAVLADAPPLSP